MQILSTRHALATLGLAGIAVTAIAGPRASDAARVGRRFDPAPQSVALSLIGTHDPGPAFFGADAAEFLAYDGGTRRAFLVNNNLAANQQVDILDLTNPAAPALVNSIVYGYPGPRPNHVAVRDGVLAVGVEAELKDAPGLVEFYDAAGVFLSAVQVCPQPVNVAFTPDGTRLLVACEGEVGSVPNPPGGPVCVDPPGALAIVDLRGGVAGVTMARVSTHDFTEFDGDQLPGVRRLPLPTTPWSVSLEPQSITISHDNSAAYVTLQEANAIARFDLRRNRWEWVRSLGMKDWSSGNAGFDASDRDTPGASNAGAISINNWPVKSFYQPDQVSSFTHAGATFILTPNEGELVDPPSPCPGLEDVRLRDLGVTPFEIADIATLRDNDFLGRLKVAVSSMDTDGSGKYDEIHAYGGRSFSIWNDAGELVWDSGSDFETITAARHGINGFQFNANNDSHAFDSRSDDKGPEPEGIAVGNVRGRTYAFINLERVGGVMVYDVSVPTAPVFVEYVNDRVWSQPPTSSAAGPLGPKGMVFVPASDSGNGKPLLLVANEVTGSVSVYQINATR